MSDDKQWNMACCGLFFIGDNHDPLDKQRCVCRNCGRSHWEDDPYRITHDEYEKATEILEGNI